jgi:deazaflavin-dependent oxidoreductase (nitroreductase family)
MNTLTKLFMALHVWIYRISRGKVWGKMRGFNVILLTTIGRKSGKTRTTPLGRFDHESGYVIVASNSEQPNNPAWYYNLKSNPQVTVQVLGKVMPATAEVLSSDARLQAWRQVIAASPFYADYEKRSGREIPLILLRLGQST